MFIIFLRYHIHRQENTTTEVVQVHLVTLLYIFLLMLTYVCSVTSKSAFQFGSNTCSSDAKWIKPHPLSAAQEEESRFRYNTNITGWPHHVNDISVQHSTKEEIKW